MEGDASWFFQEQDETSIRTMSNTIPYLLPKRTSNSTNTIILSSIVMPIILHADDVTILATKHKNVLQHSFYNDLTFFLSRHDYLKQIQTIFEVVSLYHAGIVQRPVTVSIKNMTCKTVREHNLFIEVEFNNLELKVE